MAGSRTLKLNILAETKDLVDGLKKADSATQDAGSRIGDGFKKVGLAVAAAGAAVGAFAVKLAVDGVKAAIEDEAAQAKLANTLKNVTGATNEQIAAIEKQITTTALATGVADDQLRPAMSRLALATGDTGKAQEVLNLALDISAATGKDLESVSNALGKAYEGNTASLGKLGVGLSAAEIKAMGLEGTMGALNEKFGGAAQTQAETFQGKIARLTVAFDETKETIGAALIPILSNLFDQVNTVIIPLFDRFSGQFQEKVAPALGTVIEALRDFLVPIFKALWGFLSEELIPLVMRMYEKLIPPLVDAFKSLTNNVMENKESFQPLLDILSALWRFVSGTLVPLVLDVIIAKFKLVVQGVNLFVDALAWLMDRIKPVLQLLERMVDLLSKVGGALGFGGGGNMSIGSVSAPAPSVPFVPSGNVLSSVGTTMAMRPVTNNITITGTLLDPEGTARAVQRVIQDSSSRAGTLTLNPAIGI